MNIFKNYRYLINTEVQMQIDFIVIGNELLNGKITDLNTHFLASELYKLNLNLRKAHIIGDNPDDFAPALVEAQEKRATIHHGGRTEI